MRQQLEARDSALLATGKNWMSSAACHSADPELFFPISDCGRSQDQVAQAKAVCASCQVRRECLSFALRTRQAHGIWGGMTEQERYPAAQPGGALREHRAQLAQQTRLPSYFDLKKSEG